MATTADEAQRLNALTDAVIASCIEVHKTLGPGLLESAYEECLCHELRLRGLKFERQVPLPVSYKGVNLDCGYRIDLLVEGELVVELKAVDQVLSVHMAQLQTYLRLTGHRVGLLVNFKVPLLRNGIRRAVNGFPDGR